MFSLSIYIHSRGFPRFYYIMILWSYYFKRGLNFFLSGRYILFVYFFKLTPSGFFKSCFFIKCQIPTNLYMMEYQNVYLKDLETWQYPTNIPFFLEGSNLIIFSFGICTYIGQPNILRWLTLDFFPVYISSGVMNPRALWDNLFYTYTVVLVASSHRCMERSWSWIIVFTASIMVYSFFPQNPSIGDCREWLVLSWFQLPCRMLRII